MLMINSYNIDISCSLKIPHWSITPIVADILLVLQSFSSWKVFHMLRFAISLTYFIVSWAFFWLLLSFCTALDKMFLLFPVGPCFNDNSLVKRQK